MRHPNSINAPLTIQQAYQHCLRCGTPRTDHVSDPAPTAVHCSRCGYTHHFNPIVAVGVVLHSAGQVLFIRRGRDPGAGKLGLPGGFVDLGESGEAAAVREVAEELGISIVAEQLSFVATFTNDYTYRGITIPVLDLFFAAPLAGDTPLSADAHEVSETIWATPDPHTLDQIAFPSNRMAVERWLS